MLDSEYMGKKKRGSSINKLSSALYRSGRMLRDIKAVTSGNPFRYISRIINKFLGKLFSKTWR